MNIRILSGLTVLIVVASGSIVAQDYPPDRERPKLELADDVTRAASVAKVESSDRLVRVFADSASAQREVFAAVYRDVPKEVRVARLGHYLAAKVEAKSRFSNAAVTADDLGDFHWGYIVGEVRFSPARLESLKADMFRLQSIESSGMKYDFGIKGQALTRGGAVLLPISKARPVDMVTLTFGVGNTQALWTGSAAAGRVTVVRASTTQGCEIHVNSEPRGATVYFNGKAWHRPTNTKSVQEPGSWEVIVRLHGFKDWREQRSIGPGATWTINALLVRK